MFFISVGIGLYYNVIIAWTLYYFGATIGSLFDMDSSLPWVTCDNEWNDRESEYDTWDMHYCFREIKEGKKRVKISEFCC